MAGKRKNRLLIYLEFGIFYTFYQFFRLLPLKQAYAVSAVVLRLVFLLDRKHRNRAINHLLHAGVAQSRSDAVELARRNFRHYARLMVEIIKSDQLLNRANVEKRISLTGDAETIAKVFDRNNPAQVIITLPHYGNWEVAGCGYYFLTGRQVVSIKRPLNNPLLNRMIMRQREREGHEGVEKRGALKGMLRALHDGKTVAVLVDQHAARTEGLETVFFGQPARTHFSPALLHLRTGVPILPSLCRRKPGETFEFEFVIGKLIEFQPTGDKECDLTTVTQLYTTAMEELIRPVPEQWMWVHRRWLNINRKNELTAANALSADKASG